MGIPYVFNSAVNDLPEFYNEYSTLKLSATSRPFTLKRIEITWASMSLKRCALTAGVEIRSNALDSTGLLGPYAPNAMYDVSATPSTQVYAGGTLGHYRGWWRLMFTENSCRQIIQPPEEGWFVDTGHYLDVSAVVGGDGVSGSDWAILLFIEE